MLQPPRVLDLDPVRTLDGWMRMGGGKALGLAWEVGAEVVLATLADSGLRGRGGAGFPTATKWAAVRANRSAEVPTTVVVNGAEGEPGSFKDRAILLANPYRVIEGALIAASVVGADEVVFALKEHSDAVVDRVRSAIAELDAAGWFRRSSVDVVVGPRHYLYGEETALLEVVEGRQPFPRIAPPWRRGAEDIGDDTALAGDVDLASPDQTAAAPPALVNNVETMANVAAIVVNGADWFRAIGTDDAPGTVVVTITGDTVEAGVAEVPMGTTLREAIDQIGGGPVAGQVLGVLPGVSGPLILAADLDTPLTYEAMAAIGSGLGCGAFRVIGESTDPVALAAGVSRFLAVESCGQCTPCKQDGVAVSLILDRARRSEPEATDAGELTARLATIADGARCSLATQHQLVVGSILAAFPETFAAHADPATPVADPVLVAELVDVCEGEEVIDEDQADKQPDWTYGEIDSGAAPAERLNQRAGEVDDIEVTAER